MKKLIFSTALVVIAGAAQAGNYCQLDGTEMFSCTLKNGTRGVTVCNAVWENGEKASYGFYKSNGVVEKEIVQDIATLTATPWNGMGNYISESVTFSAGDGYAYEVWWASERAAGAQLEGGINVLQDSSVIANLTCDDGTVTSDLSTLVEMVDAAQ